MNYQEYSFFLLLFFCWILIFFSVFFRFFNGIRIRLLRLIYYLMAIPRHSRTTAISTLLSF